MENENNGLEVSTLIRPEEIPQEVFKALKATIITAKENGLPSGYLEFEYLGATVTANFKIN